MNALTATKRIFAQFVNKTQSPESTVMDVISPCFLHLHQIHQLSSFMRNPQTAAQLKLKRVLGWMCTEELVRRTETCVSLYCYIAYCRLNYHIIEHFLSFLSKLILRAKSKPLQNRLSEAILAIKMKQTK